MINVIDSMCGTGKSTKMFHMMQEIFDKDNTKKFLYVTPFLTEIEERVPSTLPTMNFQSPENRGRGKLGDLEYLISNNHNVATTHVLFGLFTPKIVDMLVEKQYHLVIDEAISSIGVLSNDFKTSDTKALLKSNMVVCDGSARGKLTWNEEDYPEHDGKYGKIRSMCQLGMLYHYKEQFLMFEYPPKLLKELDNVYILTYLFKGSDMRCWLDLNKMDYKYLDNESLGLMSEKDIKADICKKLEILTNRSLASKKQQRGTLSSTWYKNAKSETIKTYKGMLRSCVVQQKAKAGEVFWTTFKDSQVVMSGAGYTKGVSEEMPSFLPMNTRATNRYADYWLCMYAINLYKNPMEVEYLNANGVNVDEDMFSLSEMIQFIWRGCIRKGEPMKVLILSERMRSLLVNWLSEE